MMEPVTVARLMGFRSGPQNHTFFACAKHATLLDKGGDVSCFFRLAQHDIRVATETEQESEECYFCRGEDGPS